MKKLLTVTLMLLMLIGCFGMTATAEGEALSAAVTVTIANKGALVATQETVTVTDADEDGALTVNDALYAVHEAASEGGAAAGYATAQTEYGLSITKLWGDESGNFGYYLNNASAWSLADAVEDGDAVYAFVYTDCDFYSDMYTYFNVTTAKATAGEAITLTLSGMGFDAEWNPVTVPVADAVITVNGEATAFKTDKNGKVTIVLDTAGTAVLSAVSETQTLVPPVCVAAVEAAPVELPEAEPEPEKIPQTGAQIAVLVAVLCLMGAAVLMGVSQKAYEK